MPDLNGIQAHSMTTLPTKTTAAQQQLQDPTYRWFGGLSHKHRTRHETERLRLPYLVCSFCGGFLGTELVTKGNARRLESKRPWSLANGVH